MSNGDYYQCLYMSNGDYYQCLYMSNGDYYQWYMSNGRYYYQCLYMSNGRLIIINVCTCLMEG